MNALLGGGTRVMLAIEHRISQDVDLFVHDAQWIGFLTPRLNDKFEARLDGYEEDSTWVKSPVESFRSGCSPMLTTGSCVVWASMRAPQRARKRGGIGV